MNKNDFEAKLEKFDLLAASTQERLTDIMSLLTDKRIPSKEELASLDGEFKALRISYEDAVALAKARLLEEELPPAGSGLKEYAIAVETSSAALIKQQIEKAEMILTRFTKIHAKLSEYALALKPYQDAAYDLLKELSEENIEDATTATVAQEVFLDVIDVENIHSPEGVALLEEVSRHYPPQVQWGLAGHQYYFDTSNNDDIRVESEQEDIAAPAHKGSEGIEIDKEIPNSLKVENSCLRKDSISVQMKRYWAFLFDKYKFTDDDNMRPSYLIDAIKKNSELLQYLYSAKDALNKDEYQTVK